MPVLDSELGEALPEGAEAPRNNFNGLLHAFTTVFVVFIGDDWNSIMYEHIRVTGEATFAYFISLFIIGNLILMNLFLASLLSNFEAD